MDHGPWIEGHGALPMVHGQHPWTMRLLGLGPRAAGSDAQFAFKSQFFAKYYQIFADRKCIKNRIPQNSAKNLKSRTPDRPNVDFGMTFGVHLGIDFHEILDFVKICVNHQNAFKQSISVGSAHPKSYIFSLNFD